MKYKLLTTMLILLIGVLGLASLASANVAWHVDRSDFVWDEDTVNVVDLSDYVTTDNGPVTFSVSDNDPDPGFDTEHITISKSGSVLTLVPDTNWYGTETISVTAEDDDNNPVSVNIDLKVMPEDVVSTDDITITKVEVDDVELSATDPNVVRFERGDTIEVKVEFVATSSHPDTKVRTWIGGYEFDDVIDTTGIFDVESGVRYVKKLHLDIPDDIDVEDGGVGLPDRFTLHVEVFDKKDTDVEEEFTLKIDKLRHKLNVLDVIFYPSNTVEPGRALRAVVRVENLGQKKEEDILVRVSIPDLGVSTRTYIDELAADKEEDDDDEETSASSRDLVLMIPKDAKPGEYTVEVDVEFSRGHEILTKRSHILVESVAPSGIVTPSGEVQPIISVDTTTQDIAQGSETLYKVMFANLGDQRVLYTVDVEGEDAWGTSRVSPSFVSVDSNQAGEAFVYIRTNENAPVGQQSFRVNVMSNANLVKTLDLKANVIKPDQSLGVLKNGLEIAFVILIVILIILGLVIAFRRVGQKERTTMPTEEPTDVGEQTYY